MSIVQRKQCVRVGPSAKLKCEELSVESIKKEQRKIASISRKAKNALNLVLFGSEEELHRLALGGDTMYRSGSEQRKNIYCYRLDHCLPLFHEQDRSDYLYVESTILAIRNGFADIDDVE